MVQRVYIDDGSWAAGLGAFILPALIPPGIVAYGVWDWLGSERIHPLYQWAGAGVVVAVFCLLFTLFYRYMPKWIAVAVTMAYMAATYGYAAHWAGLDNTWTGGIVVAIAAVGYFLGQLFWQEGHEARA